MAFAHFRNCPTDFWVLLAVASDAPIGVLALTKKAKDGVIQTISEPVYGGYANGRGEICLFGATLVYRLNFKNNTVHQRPPLNPGAQARYDATEAGEAFEFCSAKFRRLSNAQIEEICSSTAFRVMSGAF